MELFFAILLLSGLGAVSAHFAKKRGRDPVAWFFIGFLFGLLGFAVLFILPAIEEEVASEPKGLGDAFKGREWFYLNAEGKQVGPLPFGDLDLAWKSGVINEETYVWSEREADWQRIKEIRRLRR